MVYEKTKNLELSKPSSTYLPMVDFDNLVERVKLQNSQKEEVKLNFSKCPPGTKDMYRTIFDVLFD